MRGQYSVNTSWRANQSASIFIPNLVAESPWAHAFSSFLVVLLSTMKKIGIQNSSNLIGIEPKMSIFYDYSD